jgi:site-specific recombinase
MESGPKHYWANIANLVKVGYRSNAFAPLVWFNSIVDPTLLIVACILKGVLSYLLVGVLCVIVLFSLTMYVALFIKNPNLLQSERYRLEDKKLDLIASKGSGIMINPVNITPQQYIEEITGGDHNE